MRINYKYLVRGCGCWCRPLALHPFANVPLFFQRPIDKSGPVSRQKRHSTCKYWHEELVLGSHR